MDFEAEDRWYDPTDVEAIVLRGQEEDEDMDEADAAFLRGYLGVGEA